jgi:hypothetical protein
MYGRDVKRSGTMLARAVFVDMVASLGELRTNSTASSPPTEEGPAR